MRGCTNVRACVPANISRLVKLHHVKYSTKMAALAAEETDGGEDSSSSVASSSEQSSSEVSWEDEEEESDEDGAEVESMHVGQEGTGGKETSRPPAPAEASHLRVSAEIVRMEQGGGGGGVKGDAREWARGKLAAVAKATVFEQRLRRVREPHQEGARVGAGEADIDAFLRTQGV